MRNMLDTVTEFTPITEEVGDVRLEITIDEDMEKIKWMNAVNGITNTYNVVTVRFRNGAFELFVDNWNRYRIGSAEVNVDREEAIRIAKEEAQKNIRAAVGDEAASTFTFVYESALLNMQPRKDALYPHWEIHLTLNKMVLDYGAAFNVLVWADTGEISYIVYSGSYGGAPQSGENPETSTEPDQPQSQLPPLSSPSLIPTENDTDDYDVVSQSEENPETSTEPDESQSHSSTLSSPSATSSENNINPPTNTYLIAGTAATTIAVAVVAVALKKRRK